ncbi:MAG: 16S rRNA (uracil(1498)-N(3))-methyltransferase [Methylococcaceae bacterium]|nr:16S rRNA (uracil(1498)-N(3))-methyltransferase [Methylococcaceae bacterium]
MRISRLYVNTPLCEGENLRLEEESAHYLRTVLRLKKGFQLTVFNGDGHEYAAQVEVASREGVWLAIGEGCLRDTESPLYTHLGLGISRGERMDFALQKAVELGVSRITPLLTEHCVVRLDEDKKGHRLHHWQRVIRSACEQSGRNRLPTLDEPLTLDDWLEQACGVRLFLDPQGTISLNCLTPPEDRVTLLSGPEGGFSDRERNRARHAGFTPIRLGPRILRTETAVLAALAAAQTLWGDWGV